MIRCPGVPNFFNRFIILDLLLCKTADDLKGACAYTTCLRAILCEVNWIAIAVARSIKSCPVLTRDQRCVVFCSSFMLSKGVTHALFVLAYSSTPVVS